MRFVIEFVLGKKIILRKEFIILGMTWIDVQAKSEFLKTEYQGIGKRINIQTKKWLLKIVEVKLKKQLLIGDKKIQMELRQSAVSQLAVVWKR